MKILFINSTRFDYGQDLMFSGLTEILGTDSVQDCPKNKSYHLGLKSYPKNLGHSSKSNFFGLFKFPKITAKNADLVIVGACKTDCFQTYLEIQKSIPSSTPIALLDGGDRPEIGGDLERLGHMELWKQAEATRPFDFIFKREFLKGQDYHKRIHPLPFSINMHSLKAKPTDQFNKDFCFWAMESHPIRTQALELLAGQFDCDSNGTRKAQTLKGYAFKGKDYHQELAASKIVLNLRGGGWDTLRYWEVPALGPLMISTELGIVIPNDFEDKKHLVRCKDNLDDLIHLGQHYLDHESERQAIAKAGHEHLLQFHTNTKRAKYLLSIVENH